MHIAYPDHDPTHDDPMLSLLEALQAIRSPELEQILEEVAVIVAAAFCADLANVFVFRPEVTSLVALGTSATSMGRRQRNLGLDRLPLVNGGRAVWTFRTGTPHVTGSADRDPEELRGLIDGLGVRSAATSAIGVGGERRGVLLVASAERDAFHDRDLRVLGAVSGWVGLMMERAQLLKRLAAAAERRGFERADQELARLTSRQRDVAALVAEGRTNAEIAHQLALTEGTVANHMEQALRRLELRSRAQLAVWAYRQGLYRPDGDSEVAAPAAPDEPHRGGISRLGEPCTAWDVASR